MGIDHIFLLLMTCYLLESEVILVKVLLKKNNVEIKKLFVREWTAFFFEPLY